MSDPRTLARLEPDPELEELYPDGLLRHAVQAPSQYDKAFRLLAAEVLRLRAILDNETELARRLSAFGEATGASPWT